MSAIAAPALPRRRQLLPAVHGNWAAWLAMAWLAIVCIGAVAIPLTSSTPLTAVNLGHEFAPPLWSGGTTAHILGTDQLGRDLLQQLGYGARVSLLVGAASAVLAAIIGSAAGLLSGYLGGWPDIILSRLVDAQLAFPVILLGLSFAVFMQPSLLTVILAVALATWTTYARVVRSETLVLKQSDFVALATVSGLTKPVIMRRHILPNVAPSIVVLASQNFGMAVIYEAALSYLGVGVQPPSTSLGLMISQSQQFLISHSWLVIAPTIVLASVSLSANILGDWLRDRLDPALRPVP